MMTIYKVYYYERGEDEYGYPRTYKVEKYFATKEKAEDFAKKADGKNKRRIEEIVVG